MIDRTESEAPIRVLIVDDHPMFADSLARVLDNEQGMEVLAAVQTGSDAEAAAASQHFDVVVLDYRLPDMSGTAATGRIKSVSPESSIIILTGFPDESALLDSVDAGASAYLTKTQGIDDVVRAIRQVASSSDPLAFVEPSLLARVLPRLRDRDVRPAGALTPRQLEVLRLVADGVATRDIAARLALSVTTVRNHIQAILARLDAHSKLEAVSIAQRRGVLR